MPSLLLRRITLEELGHCAAVDQRCAGSPSAWTIHDFAQFFQCPWQGGYLAVSQGQAVGFLLYQADRVHRRLYLVRLAVLPGWRRRRVGSRLVQQVRRWLEPMPDVRLTALVHERELALQCFLRANGFRAIGICKGRFDEGDNDGYLFELPADQDCPIG